MNLTFTRLLLALLLVAAIAVAVACGDDDDDDDASATSQGTPRPTPALNLPADFPEDFPLYPDMTLDQSARFENQVLAAFTASGGPGEVADFYREQLASDPWEITSDNVNSQGNVITLGIRNATAGVRGTITFSEATAGAGTQVNTSFIVPQLASPLPTGEPTEATGDDTESPTDDESE